MEETMKEQEEFFSQKHKQLLNIATWAKYLSWIALALYVVDAIFVIYQKQVGYHQQQVMLDLMLASTGVDYKANTLYHLVDIGLGIVSNLLKGFISYIVLMGIALGLNMIVETDINYREKEYQGGDE